MFQFLFVVSGYLKSALYIPFVILKKSVTVNEELTVSNQKSLLTADKSDIFFKFNLFKFELIGKL